MASGDPLPLDQPAELVGEWWLPGAPNEIASGRLIYQPYEPLRLEAVSAGRLLGTSDSIPWLHGLMVDGRFVTLRNLVIVDWSLSMPGGVLAQAHVGEAFVGMYAASEAELRLHSLEARIANLTAWLDPPGFTVTRSRSIQTRDFGLVGLGRAPGGILTTAWIDVRTEAVPPAQTAAARTGAAWLGPPRSASAPSVGGSSFGPLAPSASSFRSPPAPTRRFSR